MPLNWKSEDSRRVIMSDKRNVAHDKKVAADKAKAAGDGVGEDAASHVDGDGKYTTKPHAKHPPQPGKKAPQTHDDAAEEE
jgi:hypothetical protein